MSKYEEEDFDR